MKCNYPCKTCEENANKCLECGYGGNRNAAPGCGCKAGFSHFLQKDPHYWSQLGESF